jgi:hypothetical protein
LSSHSITVSALFKRPLGFFAIFFSALPSMAWAISALFDRELSKTQRHNCIKAVTYIVRTKPIFSRISANPWPFVGRRSR